MTSEAVVPAGMALFSVIVTDPEPSGAFADQSGFAPHDAGGRPSGRPSAFSSASRGLVPPTSQSAPKPHPLFEVP